jgi:hypothetical protein
MEKNNVITNVLLEVWYQNRDGDETSKEFKFASIAEANEYYKSVEGTFTPQGRLVAYGETILIQ